MTSECPFTGHRASPLPKPNQTDRLRRGGSSETVYYHSYLQLDKLLSSTRLLSAPSSDASPSERNLQGAHDEHLFIIIHQTYELWFKQVLWELDSVVRLFDAHYVPEASVGLATSRLHRVSEILRILVDQLTVLETMSPMQFLDFRDHLFPASGFQSLQWRLIENTLGLRRERRCSYGEQAYCSFLREDHAEAVGAAEARPSLLKLVQRWLERTPFLKCKAASPTTARRSAPPTNAEDDGDWYDFWESYRGVVDASAESDAAYITARAAEWGGAKAGPADGDEEEEEWRHVGVDPTSEAAAAAAAWKEAQLKEVADRRAHYYSIIDKDAYERLAAEGKFQFTHRAMQVSPGHAPAPAPSELDVLMFGASMQAALLINLYQDEPILHQACRFLRALQDIDELMTQWRHVRGRSNP